MTVPTHEPACPCDLCERVTLPPSSRADLEAQAFEALVKRVGEGQARWTQLLAVLEEQDAQLRATVAAQRARR